ncbi:DUF4405 domain-containing protein [Affinirhizobium pseudoryzae]|jgi:hypothetical protein|uniref:DUF4405 domain-containing protein n=1 Tax=Allorhizobium pseudoryzae TaxID=379684 RepID=UPI0013EAF89C|nr:DUF4405 domain-containing protein [Allorhizobium pseudoryzae]
MASLFLRYATPLITGLFLVSLISGVALFFHWGPGAFHGIHEWLSMVLILPFVLHLWKNWRPMTAYFKRAPMAIALGLSLLASLAFFIPLGSGSGQKGAPPQVAILQLISAAKPAQIASLVGRTEEEVITVLKEKGFAAAAADRSMGDIAQSSGKSDRDLITQVASLRR